MWRLLFILSLCPFLSCWSALDTSDCECPAVTLEYEDKTPNFCSLEDESLFNLDEETKILNNSQEDLTSDLYKIIQSLDDQMDAIDDMNINLITKPLTKRQATSGQPGILDDQMDAIDEMNLITNPLTKRQATSGQPGINSGYRSCSDAYDDGNTESRLYEISLPEREKNNFQVWCTMSGKYGGGWTRILHRADASVSFEKTWNEYKDGFGEGENYFIGLQRLYCLTTDSPQTLLITLTDSKNTRYAEYAFFAIGDKNEQYGLKVLGTYQGDAGDSLREHQGLKFSTPDNMNEIFDDKTKCDETFNGGWWYKKCYKSNLCGRYYKEGEKVKTGDGIVWETMIPKTSSLKTVEMSIRNGPHSGCLLDN